MSVGITAGRLVRALALALAAVLVGVALLGLLLAAALPLAERHPQRVADWLSARAGHPVAFDTLQAHWTRRGPLLQLDGLRIGDAHDPVRIGRAQVQVAAYSGLLPGRAFTELRLRGLALQLHRDDDGRWHVRGLPGQQRTDGDPFAVLERLGELQVVGARLSVDAPGLAFHAQVPALDLRLRVAGARVRVAAQALAAPGQSPLHLVADVDRTEGQGTVYLGGEAVDLAAWSALVRHAGPQLVSGRGTLGVWASVQDSRVRAISSNLDFSVLELRAEGRAPARVRLDRLRMHGRWEADGGRGWRLDLSRLMAGDGAQAAVIEDLVAIWDGTHGALAADRLDLGPVLAGLPLYEGLAPATRAWLQAATPEVSLRQVQASGGRDGPMQVAAHLHALRFDAVGDTPGLAGLSGRLQADQDGAVFTLDPDAALRFDWPAGFGDPHHIQGHGRLVAWAEDGGWQVHTPGLRIEGDGYAADVRGGLLLRGDGRRPRIDMVARVDDAHVPVARRFWVRHQMPAAAVQWLDAALVDGYVRQGRVVVSGELAHWPFDAPPGQAPAGIFHAQAQLADVVLKFQPDWPAAEGINGQVRFIADGFDFRGQGSLAGLPARDLVGRIADFGHAELVLSANTRGDAGQVLSLLQGSPLRIPALDALQVEGPVHGRFAMQLPMHDGAQDAQVEGEAVLEGVAADAPEFGLALAAMQGQLRYDQSGLTGEAVQVMHAGHPGVLDLRGGDGHVHDARHAFEGTLRAAFTARDLLAQVPELDWLQPRVQGRSRWQAAVSIPTAAHDAAQRGVLQLDSDLVGTTLDLPAPLDKAASQALPTRVRVPLPLDAGEVTVRLGQRAAVRARVGDAPTGIRVTLGGNAAAAPPIAGLAIDGQTPRLAALEWAGLAGGGPDAADGTALALQSVDLGVGRLLLGGGALEQVRIRARGQDTGTRFEFDGPGLAGRLLVPHDRAQALDGQLQHLHWRRLAPAVAGTAPPMAASAAVDAASSGIDPATLPPITLEVADLRLDEARLGSASVMTRPVPGGLALERLRTRSDTHRIDATGQWRGRGEAQRTEVSLQLDSRNVGALLAGVGQAGRVRGGEGEVRLQAGWPGGPAGFSAQALEGHLAVVLKDGQLVDVEPGAGRVLGLLSVAELPRRLSLDFRDFFERGFAFNRIAGDVRAGGGQARSDNLVIDGPAAEIRIVGSANLHARTYDQTIEVLPKSGNLLTAVGAIAGGPVGAAVGAVANAVLKRPLGELGATTYRVSGPWADPQVDVVRREPARAPVTVPDDVPASANPGH